MDQHPAVAALGIPTSVEGWAKLAQEPPLRSILIGGNSYAVGDLSAEALNVIADIHARAGAGMPSAIDDEPCFIVRMLLVAGNPDVDWKSVRPHLKWPSYVTLSQEVYRQVAVKAFAPGAMAGQA